MSFSSVQKDVIVSQNYKASCCRRAILSGVLFAKANISFDNSVSIHIERKNVADYVARLIKEFYSVKVEISREEYGGRFYNLSFTSKSASEYISNLENDGLFPEKCPSCLSSFLRGVFLASGKISDPQRQYSLEFSLGDRSLLFADFLAEYGIVPLVSYKKSDTVVYFKNSSMIEEFCATAGLNKAVFAVLNSKAEGEIKQNINRRINCETNNIAKAVDAAAKQIDIIARLDGMNLLSSLPEELEQTARLRLAHADLSLSQLSAISIPPISKSGLSHRLNKIVELGKQLLDNINAN